MSFNPYLFFSNGQCREAFTRYHEIFGGELQVMTHGDLPEGVESMPGADPTHVMHASITLGGSLLMGSDDPTGDGGPRLGIALSYSAPDVASGQRILAQLAEGGEVTMPWEVVFWSPGFGSCTDRFGVPWMIDVEQPAPPA